MSTFDAKPFGKFFLLNKIAQGGMAEILVAVDTGQSDTENKIVIKKLLPKYSDDKRFVSMLIDEAKITSLLEFPHIVKIFDIGSIGGHFYLLLEYVEGQSLDKLIDKSNFFNKRIPPAIVSLIIDRTAKALDYAHTFKDSEGRPLSLIHRDVTPGNILLSYDGEIKLADFGIATATKDSAMLREEPAFGKKFYMAPEQIKNLQVGKSADIYALGSVAYEMLTGKKVFSAKSDIELQEKVINEAPKPPSIINPNSKKADEIVLKALSKKPADRYASTLEFAGEFRKAFPFSDSEEDNLKLILWEFFENDKRNNNEVIEKSLESFEEFKNSQTDAPVDNGADVDDGEEVVEKTEFITNDYKHSQTSFVPKSDAKPDKPDVSKEKRIKPAFKIKTKKLTQDELHEIRKEEYKEALKSGDLQKDQNMTFILPPDANKDKDKHEDKDKEDTGIAPKEHIEKSDAKEISLDNSEPSIKSEKSEKSDISGKNDSEVSLSSDPSQPFDISGEGKPLHVSDKSLDSSRTELIADDPIPLNNDPKFENEQEKKIVYETSLPGKSIIKPSSKLKLELLKSDIEKQKIRGPIPKKILIYTGTLILAALVLIFAFNIYTKLASSRKDAPVMNKLNPQTVSIIIFSEKPDDKEKKTFQRILATKFDKKYDNIGLLEDFFKSEYSRYSKDKFDFLKISFIGPIVVESPPPVKTGLLDKNNVLDYFKETAHEERVIVDKKNIVVFIYFYSKKDDSPTKYPIIYRGQLESKTQILFLPLIKDEINSSMILLANRILSIFGASEKTDGEGNPVYPDGIADPHKKPIYPQEYAEIMARYIPESRNSVKIANSLSQQRIGAKTAMEIGWITKAQYKKLMREK